jgi:phenylpropionate dioxygenase-like ring-hydroxylating dioxygenase large terminal subunit
MPATVAPCLLEPSDLIDRVLGHIDHHTTDRSDRCWREPAENYRSPERFVAERRLIGSYPSALCPSAALGEVGSFVAVEVAGVAVVAVRGDDGVARVFLNACRHRGTAVVDGSGCAASLACPYHGWTYRLDGTLRVVPHADGFPGLVRAERGLVEVPSFEAGGLVFGTVMPPATEVVEPSSIPVVVPADAELLGSGSLTVAANWKVFLEGFLEGYHIKSTHPETFFPFGYDNLNVIESFGRNSRVTFPFRRVEAQRSLLPAQRSIDGTVTTVYHLFPNVVVACLSHHTTVVVLDPVSPSETRFVTYRLSRRSGETGHATASRDSEFVERGAAEDRAMVERVQRGLSTGANEWFEFGEFEGALTHFHASLHSLLGQAR